MFRFAFNQAAHTSSTHAGACACGASSSLALKGSDTVAAVSVIIIRLVTAVRVILLSSVHVTDFLVLYLTGSKLNTPHSETCTA